LAEPDFVADSLLQLDNKRTDLPLGDGSDGSIATRSRRLLDVRFHSDSDQIADFAALRFRANSGLMRCNKIGP
jgi:hypothetical protein